MCGRTACALAPDDVVKACCYRDRQGKCRQPTWIDTPGGQQYMPAHNIAPGAFTPVLLSAKHLSNKPGLLSTPDKTSNRIVMPMKWGLVPPWHQGDPSKVPYETNNCRAEGMLDKKTYKVPLMRGNRCVILAEGFFEWKSSKDGKQPYYFYFPQDQFNSKSLQIKKEDDEFPATKVVKTEKLENTKPISDDNQSHGLNSKDEVHLKGLGHKACLVSTANTNTSETNLYELKKEVDSCNGSTELGDSLVSCEKQISTGDLQTNIPIKVECPPCSEKQEIMEHLRTRVDDEDQGEDETSEETETPWHGPKLLTMAGVFDVWKADQCAAPLYSYSVITVSASRDMDWCHHRMPAILSSEEEVQNWLDFSSLPLNKAAQLIKPKVCLSHHAVSKQVNNSRYQSADTVKPVKIGQPISTPGSKFMQQWLKSGSSPEKRKLQDLSDGTDSKSGVKPSEHCSSSKKKKEREGGLMRWLSLSTSSSQK